MVLNIKIEKIRENYDIFIPYTDGKGPITRDNLRRLKIERIKKMFGKKCEESKVNKYINDLCKS